VQENPFRREKFNSVSEEESRGTETLQSKKSSPNQGNFSSQTSQMSHFVTIPSLLGAPTRALNNDELKNREERRNTTS
jgi:hypothetical protein